MSNLSDKELTSIMNGFSRMHFKHRLCSALRHENTTSVLRLLNLKLHEECHPFVTHHCCCIEDLLTFETPHLPFGGVFPSDHLPPHQTENVCYIFNTDPSTKPGEHWVSYYQVGGRAEFFDSFGNCSSHYPPIDAWLRQGPCKPVEQFTVRIQGPSMLCGSYCVYFLNERSYYPSMSSVINSVCYPFRKLRRGEDAGLTKEELKCQLGENDAYVFSYLAAMMSRFVQRWNQ